MIYDFSFNGKWLTDLGGLSMHKPPVEIAQRDYKMVDLAGKSESDYIDLHRYKNVQMKRDINFGYSNIYDQIPFRLAEWLQAPEGYQDFEDTDHPGLIGQACVESISELEKPLGKIYRSTVKFNRKPFWYSKDGLIYQSNSSNSTNRTVTFTNPYAFPAQPLVKITLSNSALSDNGQLFYTHKFYKPDGTTPTVTLYMENLQGTVGSYNYVIIDFEQGTAIEYDNSGAFVQFVQMDASTPAFLKFDMPGDMKVACYISNHFSNCAKLEVMPRFKTL